MQQKEWMEYFEVINGRKPTPEEFSNASNSGEFTFEEVDKNTAEGIFVNEPTLQDLKVGNNTDIRLLKQEIQLLDQDLAQAFFELGMNVYQNSIHGKFIEVSKNIDSILKLNIENYHKKKLLSEMISDGKSCLSCEASIGIDDRFCAVCGNDVQALEKHEKNTRKSCELCEVEQSGANSFCACCGKMFE
ncbi:hypothetical protein [Streptococcus mitis]|uniref:hypothetical protein n=1 Tax=Streptococcus mitis TaxID=28037 RepID=UPI0020012C5E|nr:hypothetical protein [Streptococcus mitis]